MRLPGGERAAAVLKEFAESFQERNPHLRVFNMVLHMDEATPHLHVDYIPVATEQSRGLSHQGFHETGVKAAGFEGQGRKQDGMERLDGARESGLEGDRPGT